MEVSGDPVPVLATKSPAPSRITELTRCRCTSSETARVSQVTMHVQRPVCVWQKKNAATPTMKSLFPLMNQLTLSLSEKGPCKNITCHKAHVSYL